MSSIDGMTPLERTHSENASADSGVDLPPDLYEGGLMIRSTSFPEAVAARQVRHICFEVLASNSTLLEGLPLAREGWTLADGIPKLYAALERAAATARTRPNRVAGESSMKKDTKSMEEIHGA